MCKVARAFMLNILFTIIFLTYPVNGEVMLLRFLKVLVLLITALGSAKTQV